MTDKRRTIEIFSAGCSLCDGLVQQIEQAACASCRIDVLDMNVPEVQKRAGDLGIKSVPAVVVDGKLADCCGNRGVDLSVLRAAGLGQPIG